MCRGANRRAPERRQRKPGDLQHGLQPFSSPHTPAHEGERWVDTTAVRTQPSITNLSKTHTFLLQHKPPSQTRRKIRLMSLDTNQRRVRSCTEMTVGICAFFWIRHWGESVSWQDSDPECCLTSLFPAVSPFNTSFYFWSISEPVIKNTYVWPENPPGRLWDLGL